MSNATAGIFFIGLQPIYTLSATLSVSLSNDNYDNYNDDDNINNSSSGNLISNNKNNNNKKKNYDDHDDHDNDDNVDVDSTCTINNNDKELFLFMKKNLKRLTVIA